MEMQAACAAAVMSLSEAEATGTWSQWGVERRLQPSNTFVGFVWGAKYNLQLTGGSSAAGHSTTAAAGHSHPIAKEEQRLNVAHSGLARTRKPVSARILEHVAAVETRSIIVRKKHDSELEAETSRSRACKEPSTPPARWHLHDGAPAIGQRLARAYMVTGSWGDGLPDEVTCAVMRHLDAPTLVRASSVCQCWR